MSKEVELSKTQLETIFLQCIHKETFEHVEFMEQIFTQVIEEKLQAVPKDIQSSAITPELEFAKTIQKLSISSLKCMMDN